MTRLVWTHGKSVSEVIADGLDAAVDGRGYDEEHYRATRLADAAPDLHAVLLGLVGALGNDVLTDSPERARTVEEIRELLVQAQAVLTGLEVE